MSDDRTANDIRWLNDDTALIDVRFQGIPRAIAVYLLDTSDGLAVVDPGPTTSLDNLNAVIRQLGRDPSDIRHILATHIHLDHTGGVGTMMRQLPDATLYVHEIGAPHMIDPAALIRSAARIYTGRMDELWGEVEPVPAERVVVLSDGDVLDIGGRHFDVLYTPGHASHHVSFHEPASGLVFAGDVGGIRFPPLKLAWPPTPPPDITVEGWHTSTQRLRELNPAALLITHFGVIDEHVIEHLDELDRNLDELAGMIDRLVQQGLSRDEIIPYVAKVVEDAIAGADVSGSARALEMNTPFFMEVDGLLRYLRKRAEAQQSAS
jgi:glyoxylase-like metal-dependent hydrolase (beta-lactamase superfamily II)